MTEQEKFLAAIEENPKDYFLRQAYADWLEENDQPEEADRQRKYEEAEKWLTDFAARCGSYCTNYGIDAPCDRWEPVTLEIIVQAGIDFVQGYDWWTQVGSERARNLLADHDELKKQYWSNWEIVTGLKSPGEDFKDKDGWTMGNNPFSCTC